jgi:hypothetical protein
VRRAENVGETNVSTVDRLLRPLEQRLTAVPTDRPTAAERALEIAQELREDPGWAPIKTLGQLTNDVLSTSRTVATTLTASEPPPVGDRRYDAYIAAVVEHRFGQDAPGWVFTPSRYITPDEWVLNPAPDNPELEAIIRAETPAAFARHGIYISSADLESA